VSVRESGDTAAFAGETIRRWWDLVGMHAYPDANRLLITADAGGSNGYRTRLWKVELAKLAKDAGIEITVCHFPPGTSKWNKVVIYTGIGGVYEVSNMPAFSVVYTSPGGYLALRVEAWGGARPVTRP